MPHEERSVPKLVYDFTEGSKDQKDLLGGKGANLAEMTNIGLPVPPGFIISTDACRAWRSLTCEEDPPPARRPLWQALCY